MKKTLFILIAVCACTMHGYSQTGPDSTKTGTDSLKAVQPAPAPAPSGNTQSTAQPKARKDTRPFMKRLQLDMMASFWVNSTSVFFEFCPVIWYHFPKIWSIGTGPVYMYNRQKDRDITLNGWGGKLAGKCEPIRWFYLYTEYQGISSEYVTSIDLQGKSVEKSSQYVDQWFLGAGLSLHLGRKSINVQGLYDFLYDEDTSPYYSAWIYRISFGF